ncbi:mediator of RNA polymerase II transcription subunit 10 [Rhizodiscina lignyota]|uniref:Mediator of RNA polymerase II transcription subunit 10 n=1 Tax=Rhizodiscina lignyota TaxID=1504668 RepID=A0A9P4IJ99_9PEZI|nr:mediator of RNA polymerase II transcription subunit 10 [Rhizodiscina lignyota]
MAPQQPQLDGGPPETLRRVDDQMKSIVQNLFNLIVQAHDHKGAATENAMREQIKNLVQNLSALSRTAPSLPIVVPPELIQYVQDARNPDIYTRQFVERVMELNQKLKGKSEAFGNFRDILARQMIAGIEGIEDDVHRVVESTGGSR